MPEEISEHERALRHADIAMAKHSTEMEGGVVLEETMEVLREYADGKITKEQMMERIKQQAADRQARYEANDE